MVRDLVGEFHQLRASAHDEPFDGTRKGVWETSKQLAIGQIDVAKVLRLAILEDL
jgi:hypothetical protein